MAGLVRRIVARQILPPGTGAQDPEHAVQHRARIVRRPARAAGAAARKERREDGPLLVGEVHARSVRRDRAERNIVKSEF